jgi:hypothetical protein
MNRRAKFFELTESKKGVPREPLRVKLQNQGREKQRSKGRNGSKINKLTVGQNLSKESVRRVMSGR